MYPDLFGIEGFSMVVMILLGVVAATILLFVFLKKEGVNKKVFLDLSLVIIATMLVAIIFAILFENLYESIKHAVNNEPQAWTWGMTFYGGLFGGVVTFILMYRFYYLRANPPIFDKIIIIAPASITLGHAFGRVGCFLSGCCYGIESHSSADIYFPIHNHSFLPTQLYEMGFLLVLAIVFIILAFLHKCRYQMVIYAASYGVFRFIIEFFRGDERGQLAGLSPSQYWCLILILGSIPLYFVLKKYLFERQKENEI